MLFRLFRLAYLVPMPNPETALVRISRARLKGGDILARVAVLMPGKILWRAYPDGEDEQLACRALKSCGVAAGWVQIRLPFAPVKAASR